MFRIDRFGDLSVLFVMATDQEYGPHLRRLIHPLITGVGPVEGAARLAAVLGGLEARGHLPDMIFSLGSAGSRTLDHAAVYQVASVAYRDMDASALGVEIGVTPFLNEPAIALIPHRIADVPAASLSTGGAIITGVAYEGIAADMVDMETYAFYRAARLFNRPLIGLRGISDGRADLTGIHDWTEYLHELDEKMAAIIAAFADEAANGCFRLELETVAANA
jgi:adenosylhomocysteine nucleosidase